MSQQVRMTIKNNSNKKNKAKKLVIRSKNPLKKNRRKAKNKKKRKTKKNKNKYKTKKTRFNYQLVL